MTSNFAFATLGALALLASPALAEGDPAKGEQEFNKCKSCHMIESADETIVRGGKTGPNLYGVVGRAAGTAEGFRYGDDLVAAGEAGLVWDAEQLAEYMEDPREFLREYLDDNAAKSRMTFKMKRNAEDVAAYLATPEIGAATD
ncbi:MAG: c-type cytochrome [Pseudooceanicola sp.]